MTLTTILQHLDSIPTVTMTGRVMKAVGLTLESTGTGVSIGQRCDILSHQQRMICQGEVVGFRDQRVLVMPFGQVRGIQAGDAVRFQPTSPHLPVGHAMLGRVLDGLGQPLDEQAPLVCTHRYPLYAPAPSPMSRNRIADPLDLGVRAINAMLTCGVGQKVGIFSGSGVGKSVLLGMIARQTTADINVIALVGERGREVKEFIERDLGPEGLRRSVIIAATSDQSPLVRVRAVFVATAIAEYFRDQGNRVLLFVDSLTRLAHAQREVGLAAGEPPTSKGYPPSVFTVFPQVLERVGPLPAGSITGLYTVLVDGDDLNDPIADTIRSILDGHLVLTRSLAMEGHFPAVDVLQSVSRVMSDIVPDTHLDASRFLAQLMNEYRQAKDLIDLGAYQSGSNRRLDVAIALREQINYFLRQDRHEAATLEDSVAGLQALVAQAKTRMQKR
ncbi:MAG: FliI/YscN family ATPase [Nitrospirales bacterium]|nr:FliI/YscN family ATPase [Nitrospira sp.]MCA9479162.1 FliI/YscN family ATPase [Nitrospira sp.]MCB9711431.1 FliI/YscN family ATPase [Nitrospiraceae bacterium]MDR4486253.1 FliI/YscN family ATPase [Nitrospirales bacterium]